jgi:hypothetical protein
MAGAAKRNEAGAQKRRFVDCCVVAFLELPRKSACRDMGVSSRILDDDQCGELQSLGEGDASDLPQRVLPDKRLRAVDRSLEDRSRVSLRRHEPPGPDGAENLAGGLKMEGRPRVGQTGPPLDPAG